jgi:hypothetical protein
LLYSILVEKSRGAESAETLDLGRGNRRTFYPFMKKVADKYANICGYRQHGLKYDDLIIEENETVQVVSPPRRRAQEAGRG